MSRLYWKHLLIRTPLEKPANLIRDLSKLPERRRHPELYDLFSESARIERVLGRLIQPDWNCVDIGCHIGSHLSFILRCAPRGKHIAFEPDREKAGWLKRKFPEVEVLNMAVGEANEIRTFYTNLSNAGFSGFTANNAHPDRDPDSVRETKVECRRLDDVLPSRRFSYIKIDVEGAELLVLKGAQATIARDRPVILFESSHDAGPRLGIPREDLFTFFVDQLHYDVFLVKNYIDGKPPLGLERFLSAAVFPFAAFNFLALPRS